MRVLITGSCGLIGSEAAEFYLRSGHEVLGIDNNLRKYFFGAGGDTTPRRLDLQAFKTYRHQALDIRDREKILKCVAEFRPDFIIHAASQPSHDWAAKEPFTDFDVNANGTLNLLEATRLATPQAVFVFLSTNKVYGDNPNRLPLRETPTRYDFEGPLDGVGIDEQLTIDGGLHSLFGCSKLAADVLTQEYGRYFNLNTGVFRGGCLTGSHHAAVELHGFLSYFVQSALKGRTYRIFGYQGKQVRDQIHSSDVIQALELFRKSPKAGEVYNLGGGFENSASILELVKVLKSRFNLTLGTEHVGEARKGDHICYYTNMSKFRKDYPQFKLEMSLDNILGEMVEKLDRHFKKAA